MFLILQETRFQDQVLKSSNLSRKQIEKCKFIKAQQLHLSSLRKLFQPRVLDTYLTALRGFPCLDSSFFWFKNAPTPLCLSRDKTKCQSGKNTILTPTKTLFKKYGHSLVNFQITLSTYKLHCLKNTNFYFARPLK